MRRLFAVALLGILATSCTDDRQEPAATTPVATQAALEEGELSVAARELESCGNTPSSTEGPYYISGTRALDDGNLNYDDLDGTPMRVGGYVYASEANRDAVSGAKIEIWHTDDDGAYHPQGAGPATNYSEDDLSLRGYVTSDEDGYYEFTSIFPGEYEGRSRHIHLRVTADGHEPLVTQIITPLEGDRFPPDQDMVASNFPDCSIVDFPQSDGERRAPFNLHIA